MRWLVDIMMDRDALPITHWWNVHWRYITSALLPRNQILETEISIWRLHSNYIPATRLYHSIAPNLHEYYLRTNPIQYDAIMDSLLNNGITCAPVCSCSIDSPIRSSTKQEIANLWLQTYTWVFSAWTAINLCSRNDQTKCIFLFFFIFQ